MKEISDRRYPIGKFEYGKSYSNDETRKHIKSIARLPKSLKKTLKKLRDGALDKPYRSGGWTARQVIHHIADSHMNAYIRFKLAATEDTPIIKPYVESSWAETEDAKHGSARSSLKILTALHDRWVGFIVSLNEDELDRGFYHPVSKRTFSLREAIALYAWHGKHHLAHIKIVADGNFEKTANKKGSTNKSKESLGKKDEGKSSAEKAAAPKKRVMSEAHKAKIRAAQQARRAAEKAAKPEAVIAVVAKRGRKPLQPQNQSENQKAQAQSTIKAGATPVKTRRPRRSSAEVAAEKAAKAAMPKLSRNEILANARAVAAAKRAAAGKSVSKNAPAAGKAKPGRPAKAAAATVSGAGKAKPGRPAKAAAATVSGAGKAKPGRPAKAAAAAPTVSGAGKAKPGRPADKAPKKAAPEKPKRIRRSAEVVAAEKAAKAAAPKLSRAEIMAKARAARTKKK